MAISKYNSEGYHNPTTYEALKTVENEERVPICTSRMSSDRLYISAVRIVEIQKRMSKKQDSTLALQLRIRRSLLLRIFCIHSLWMTVIRKKDIWQTIPSIMYWLESARKCGCLERMARKGWLVR